jgi:hypothetical protein
VVWFRCHGCGRFGVIWSRCWFFQQERRHRSVGFHRRGVDALLSGGCRRALGSCDSEITGEGRGDVMAKVKVILMRRDKLDDNEEATLLQSYPEGTVFEFYPTDPVDYLAHMKHCERIKPDVVVLPREKPVPVDAMKAGFAHISMTPNGFQRLSRVDAHFIPFVPGQPVRVGFGMGSRLGALEFAIEVLRQAGARDNADVLEEIADEMKALLR